MSPAAAAFWAGLFSGLGHLGAGSPGAALVFLGLELAGWAGLIAWAAHPVAGLPWVGGILFGILIVRLASVVAALRAARARAKQGGGIGTATVLFLAVPVLLLVQAFAFVRFVLPQFVPLYGVPSSAMEPTLMGHAGPGHPAEQCAFAASHRPPTGDHILVSRMAYWGDPVRRFDVVVFRFPLDRSKSFVKRVVGLPGEELMLKGGALHVRAPGTAEFRIVQAPRALEFRPAPGYRPDSLGEGQTLTIPDECYFMLGDNSGRSHDGRSWIRQVYEMKDGARIECEAQSVETSLFRIKEITEREGLDRPPTVVIRSDRGGKERYLYREDIREERREPFRFVHRSDLVGRAVKIWWPSARAGAIR